MASSVQHSSCSPASTFAYRTGYYVGTLYGYQLVSEVSPVDGPDFCQGFADGIAVITSWLKRYLAEGGTFESALGDLLPYFPTLRSWVGDAATIQQSAPARPPSSRERQRRYWEQEISKALSDYQWSTAKDIAERLNGRGPHTMRTLNHLLREMAATGQVERSQGVDVDKRGDGIVRWRLLPVKRST
jgi:hypothetical protein